MNFLESKKTWIKNIFINYGRPYFACESCLLLINQIIFPSCHLNDIQQTHPNMSPNKWGKQFTGNAILRSYAIEYIAI